MQGALVLLGVRCYSLWVSLTIREACSRKSPDRFLAASGPDANQVVSKCSRSNDFRDTPIWRLAVH